MFQMQSKIAQIYKKYSKVSSRGLSINLNDFLRKQDSIQLNLLKENCILVNENDEIIGSETKINCHLMKNIEKGMLHRAFSIFLFDNQNRLLLQQRSNYKITYPNHWTNTCCSHPIYIDEECSEIDNIGIKKAAKRRLLYEFGIHVNDINLFDYITRIHYKASNVPHDGIFGEHEIDYILFLKGNFKLDHNKNEIKSYKYVDYNELRSLVDDLNKKSKSEVVNNSDLLLTPWFQLICNKFLFDWWLKLYNTKEITDKKNIFRF